MRKLFLKLFSATAAFAGIALFIWAAAAQQQQPRQNGQPPAGKIRKPSMSDTIRANICADNNFMLWINGELVAVDSITFIPHNVISVDLLPSYPVTIAVMARDNASPKTGMEYADTNIGDGGFILKFSDGTVTSSEWKALCVSRGPLNRDTKNPQVENLPVPENWQAVSFDDSGWKSAREYTEEEIDPKQPYFENDFAGAKFIWTDDAAIDNTILMMADDQGWNGTSVAMHPDIPGSRGEIWHTPNLERLAAQMRFSAGYSPAPVCSPTRISIQTGKSPAQLHWTKAAPPEQEHKLTEPRLIKQISSSEKTLGELLQSVGYATAH